MPTQLQFRRGSNSQSTSFTGAAGEITVNTDLGTLHVHDGSTVGGNLILSANVATIVRNKTFANVDMAGNLVPNANLLYNLGNTVYWWNTFYGVSSQAKYADLAEKYTSDAEYEVGTVVVFGGQKEVTQSTQDHDTRVAGVVSGAPAYLMNAGDTSGVNVGLTGRVPCKVKGPVMHGDVLVTSNFPGTAQRIDDDKFKPGCVLGKALATITSDEIQTIEIVVGRH